MKKLSPSQIAREQSRAELYANQRDLGEIYRTMGEIIRSFDYPITQGHAYNTQIIQQVLENHDCGMFHQSGRMADFLLMDDQVAGSMNTRLAWILSLLMEPENLKITPSRVGGQLSQTIARWWQENLFAIVKPANVESIMRDSHFMGFAIQQIIWDKDYMPRLERWHPSLCYYNRVERNFRLLTQNFSTEAINGESGKWMIYSPFEHYLSWQHAGIRVLSNLWLQKTYAMRDWARYSQVYGNLIKLLRIPQDAKESDKANMLTAVQNLQQEGVLPMNRSRRRDDEWDLELVAPPTGSSSVFKDALEFYNKSIATYNLGQNVTTDMKGGAYNAVESILDGVALSRARLDVTYINSALFASIVRPITRIKWGSADLAPRITIDSDAIQYQTGSNLTEKSQGSAPSGGGGSDKTIGGFQMGLLSILPRGSELPKVHHSASQFRDGSGSFSDNHRDGLTDLEKQRIELLAASGNQDAATAKQYHERGLHSIARSILNSIKDS
jgi:phage gp29-like protein